MARIEPRGNSYRFIVYDGYDADGNQITHKTTWKPAPGMTKKQAEKEARRQAELFEDRIKRGLLVDSSMKFADFAEKWFKEYAEQQLKPKTIAHYRALINKSIGHISLEKLQPLHLQAFYNELRKEGIRHDQRAQSKIDLTAIRKEQKLTKVKLSAAAS